MLKISDQYISLPSTFSCKQSDERTDMNMKTHRQRPALLKAANKIKEWKKARSKHCQEFTGLHTKFHVFTQSQQILALFTHLSDMSISRCVQRWQIFAYAKQAPTPFEVLLNRLPHFTTDTLSHSSWCWSIWSCNMNTCIQTREHSRNCRVMLTLLRYLD